MSFRKRAVQVFQGFSGTLDASGAATLGLAVPMLPALSGAVVTLAAVTASGPANSSITNSVPLVVQ